MSVYRVIDKLESTVKDGVWLPFGGRIVNHDRMLDLVEKLRASLPEEVSRAKAVTREKDRLLLEAKSQAQAIVEEASSTKSHLLSESDVAREAHMHAQTIVAEAEEKAREIRRGADEYADQVLSALDGTLSGALAAVHKGRQTLAAGLAGGNGSPRQREPR
jgi:cell division septum initiation protein DivIVA